MEVIGVSFLTFPAAFPKVTQKGKLLRMQKKALEVTLLQYWSKAKNFRRQAVFLPIRHEEKALLHTLTAELLKAIGMYAKM